MTLILPFSSSISAWHSYSAILQLIYIPLSQQIIWSLVLFHSHLSTANKAIPSRVAMTWSHLPIPSFIQHLAICLGLAILQATTRRQSSERKHQSQWKSCVKAYLLPSVNSSPMSIGLRAIPVQYGLDGPVPVPLSILLTNWTDGRRDGITCLTPSNVRPSRHWMALDGFTLFCSNSKSLMNVK